MPDYDSPWKEMLESYFPDFMAFFFPEAAADIDWTRGYISLETELRQIVRDAALGRRLADKLMQVWRRNGQAQVVLIHTEIQGQREDAFAKRMYVYHYRLFDRYDQQVVSLAILTDRSPTWRPTEYSYSLWGCEVRLRFPMVKLRDYAARWEELESSTNPFAVVVMAHLQRQATRRNPEGRLHSKLHILRHLYSRGYTRQQILDIFRFIDWVLTLPAALEQRFDVELTRLEDELHMPYVTSIERRGLARGRQEGLQEGLQQGLQEGLQQGLQQGLLLVLKRLIRRRFGAIPAGVEARLEQAIHAELEQWVDRILDIQQLDELFTTPSDPTFGAPQQDVEPR